MYQPYIPLSQPFSPCLALARELVSRLWVTTGKIPAAALRLLAVLNVLSASARLAAAAALNFSDRDGPRSSRQNDVAALRLLAVLNVLSASARLAAAAALNLSGRDGRRSSRQNDAAALRLLAVLNVLSASARLAAAAAPNNPGQRPQGVEYEIA
ncbi:hypothetical protein ACSVCE_14820 [Chromobacterium haemolyticum]|uniref:hypothetical protein n=1 Tax=Chromobacterium haemolyticum TaxID=394935 RepID=UPI0012F937F0|nr:hypothetical protein [Chromobacterium haemolyticum]